MHAYKDAIRRTSGAYVLYPGDKPINQKGFHEIIPGLGAFPVKPSKTDSGIGELQSFILEIVVHFINRASQREKIAFRTYDIFKNAPDSDNVVKAPLPESYNANRDLIPDETFVLVGYYKSEDHYKWIQKNGLYNFRMGPRNGSLVLNKETLSSKYLLLHTKGDQDSGDIWKIESKGVKVYSKDELIKMDYPDPQEENYLVIEIQPVTDSEFENVRWDFRELSNYSKGRSSAFPFTASMSELMKNIKR